MELGIVLERLGGISVLLEVLAEWIKERDFKNREIFINIELDENMATEKLIRLKERLRNHIANELLMLDIKFKGIATN